MVLAMYQIVVWMLMSRLFWQNIFGIIYEKTDNAV